MMIGNSHYGFTKPKACLTSLPVKQGKSSGRPYLDFSKAFDSDCCNVVASCVRML